MDDEQKKIEEQDELMINGIAALCAVINVVRLVGFRQDFFVVEVKI